MLPYLTFREATGKTASLANLARRVRAMPVEGWLVVGSRLLRDESAQQEIVQALPPDVRKRIERHAGQRVVLFPDRVHALMRAALLYAPDGPCPESFGPFATDIALALLEADAFDDHTHQSAAPQRMLDFVVQSFLRGEARRGNVPPLDVGRAHRLFVELPDEMTDVAEVAHADIPGTFEREAGMPLRRHVAIRAGISTRFMTVDTSKEGYVINAAYLGSTKATDQEVRRVLEELGSDVATLRAATQRLPNKGRVGLHDSRPFPAHTLARLTSDVYVPTDPDSLLVRLVGDGLWWRMRMAFRDRGSDFQAAVGRAFERYVTELSEAAIDAEMAKVIPEFEYRSGDLGPDLIVVDDRATLVIEASAERPMVANTILAGDAESFQRDLLAIVQRRVRDQLAPKTLKIASGEIQIPRDPQTTIAPILLLIDGFPRGPVLNDWIRDAGRAEGLGAGRTTDLVILEAAEWEALCGAAETHGLAPSELIARWLNTTPDAELLEVIAATFDEIPLPKYTADAFERATAMWIDELGVVPPPDITDPGRT